MLRAFRRQSPTDSQTLGLLCGEEYALSICLADRAAAGVPAVLALRDSTWNTKQKWGRWVIPGVSIRRRCCDCCSFRTRVSRCQPGSPRTSRDGTHRFRCGGTTRPEAPRSRRWSHFSRKGGCSSNHAFAAARSPAEAFVIRGEAGSRYSVIANDRVRAAPGLSYSYCME